MTLPTQSPPASYTRRGSTNSLGLKNSKSLTNPVGTLRRITKTLSEITQLTSSSEGQSSDESSDEELWGTSREIWPDSAEYHLPPILDSQSTGSSCDQEIKKITDQILQTFEMDEKTRFYQERITKDTNAPDPLNSRPCDDFRDRNIQSDSFSHAKLESHLDFSQYESLVEITPVPRPGSQRVHSSDMVATSTSFSVLPRNPESGETLSPSKKKKYVTEEKC